MFHRYKDRTVGLSGSLDERLKQYQQVVMQVKEDFPILGSKTLPVEHQIPMTPILIVGAVILGAIYLLKR